MRCLYCGKQLALFRRLTGSGEFCSDAHKDSYHEEYNRLAVNRLVQAQQKSDELRAAAPKNRQALATSDQGEAPAEGLAKRSLPGWAEEQQKKADTAAAAEVAAKTEIPKKSAAPARVPEQELQPELDPPEIPFLIPPMPAAVAWEVKPFSILLEAQSHSSECRLPDWSPVNEPIEPVFEAAGFLDASALPQPGNFELNPVSFVPHGVTPMTPALMYPAVRLEPRKLGFRLLPPVDIDPRQFAPRFDVKPQKHVKSELFRFDCVIIEAPEPEFIEKFSEPATVQDQLAVPESQPDRHIDLVMEADIPEKLEELSTEYQTSGDLARLADMIRPSIRPAMNPFERMEERGGSVVSSAIPVRVGRSAVVTRRLDMQASSLRGQVDGEYRRPSAVKMKLAAMAAAMPPATPASEPTDQRPGVASVATDEEKVSSESSSPSQRADMPVPAPASVSRRRTVPIPSILDADLEDANQEDRSLWGSLRKYLKG